MCPVGPLKGTDPARLLVDNMPRPINYAKDLESRQGNFTLASILEALQTHTVLKAARGHPGTLVSVVFYSVDVGLVLCVFSFFMVSCSFFSLNVSFSSWKAKAHVSARFVEINQQHLVVRHGMQFNTVFVKAFHRIQTSVVVRVIVWSKQPFR